MVRPVKDAVSLSKSEHIAALAREILDDVELSRLSAEALVLKATRLARATGSEEMRKWLGFEMTGYPSADADASKWMLGVGRWTVKDKLGYFYPIGQVEAYVAAYRQRLSAIRIPDVNYAPTSSNPYERVTDGSSGATFAVTSVLNEGEKLANSIAALSGIRSRVVAWIHTFAAHVYYQKAFSSVAETIFERHKAAVDGLLAQRAAESIEKVPAIYARLAEGDTEAVSHALTSCRRLIDSFADAVYPARDGEALIGDQPLQVGAPHHKNRINVYVAERTGSAAQRLRLRQTLTNIYDRTSAGVHDNVSPSEARSLFLQTYLLLGEILELGQVPAAPAPAPPPADASAQTPSAVGEGAPVVGVDQTR